MKLEVTKNKMNRYTLNIDGENIVTTDKLSAVVIKIEKYLKIRFLDEKTESTLDKIGGFFQP